MKMKIGKGTCRSAKGCQFCVRLTAVSAGKMAVEQNVFVGMNHLIAFKSKWFVVSAGGGLALNRRRPAALRRAGCAGVAAFLTAIYKVSLPIQVRVADG